MKRFWQSWADDLLSIGWIFSLLKRCLRSRRGVSKRTVERVEAGATTQMSTMIRILRVLGLLNRFETKRFDRLEGEGKIERDLKLEFLT